MTDSTNADSQRTTPGGVTEEWPDPTPEMLADSQFEAIWQRIKKWDISTNGSGHGALYSGATGNHVRAILDAIGATPARSSLPRKGTIETTHPEGKCERCGGGNVTWFAPSPIWNAVVRKPNDRDEMLCPVCFIVAAEAAGFNPPAWKVEPELKDEVMPSESVRQSRSAESGVTADPEGRDSVTTSLPPDFGKLIEEYRYAVRRLHQNKDQRGIDEENAARAALEAAIASIGPPSGDLERAAKVADGLDKPFNVKPRTVQGKSFERGARTAAKEIADGIRALASLAEKEGTP